MATKRKTPAERVKGGPRTDAENKTIEAKLRILYYKDGITIQRAAIEARCSAPYASNMYKKFGAELAQYAIDTDEDWLAKNDRVRARALEGTSVQIIDSDQRLGALKNQMRTAKEMQINILPAACEKLEAETGIREFIQSLDGKTFMNIYSQMGTDLNMWKNYGYYIQQIGHNIRAEVTLQAEFQEQYDTIEILPPPSEILDKMVEQHIAAKNGLIQSTTPTEEKPILKPKSKRKKQ